MPYIPQSARFRAAVEPQTAGELNFALTTLILKYLELTGMSYAALNTCVGALECCKHEMYRRLAVPYENGKRLEHGDVFPHAL